MSRYFLILLLSTVSAHLFAQGAGSVKGTVSGTDIEGHKHPLLGANVYWLSTINGTTTDEIGFFKLKKANGINKLVVSYIGYESDTITVNGEKNLEIVLTGIETLEGVEIVHRTKSANIDFLESRKVENYSEKELLKAACCNLSESFDTNPSVDVSFQDAVTGTKQIKMLGLDGPNIQITRENMPDVRGLSAVYGLTYIPGTWIDGIQVVKGTGSVVNGYESIAGQINVNLRKPYTMDKVLLNAYVNEGGRLEGNANFGINFNDDLGTALLIHASNNSVKNDRNEDGFLDRPLGNQVAILNRWELRKANGLHFEAGIKGTWLDKTGGQVVFDPATDKGTTNAWGMQMETNRLEGWTKLGKVNTVKPWQSFGIQLSGVSHDQKSYFGLTDYNGRQNSLYANVLFQSIISTTDHKILTGASFQYDDFKENLNADVYERTEVVPGVFGEYTYNHLDRITAVVGLRVDHHNLYGTFFTPRLHMRYAFNETAVLRLSAGRGLRTASIIAENTGLLASSRQIIVEGNDPELPFGLNPEIAWNYGINFTQDFTIDYRNGFFSVDFYRTDFMNQIVVDLDRSPQQAVFYNLSGKSYSNSFQAQVDYELIKRLDMRLAYRRFDVKSTYDNQLLQKPLIAKDRFFMNLAYETRKYWKMDYTVTWFGKKRIPSTDSNPEPYQLESSSPGFVVMNAQLSKTWREKLDVYMGVENLLNYRQDNPILASEEPFSPYFDSSLVWGPVFGRNIYMGVRYRIK